MFSTCFFSEDFAPLKNDQDITQYNKTLYNHLRKAFDKDQVYATEFMDLTSKTDDQSINRMSDLRKVMAANSQQVKLFNDYRKLFEQLSESYELLDMEEDKETKELVKEEIEEIFEQIEEQAEDIVEVIVPENDSDKRDCTLEILQAAGGSESSLFAHDLMGMY